MSNYSFTLQFVQAFSRILLASGALSCRYLGLYIDSMRTSFGFLVLLVYSDNVNYPDQTAAPQQSNLELQVR